MTRIKCPSEDWDHHYDAEERAHCPSNSDMLAELDAYGHLTWIVGFGSEGDEDHEKRGDWLACFDFKVFDHPDRGILVAYHTVINSESGGFIDTLESGVVEADKAPFDLPNYWRSIGEEHEVWTEQECEDASKVNEAWNVALREELQRTKNEAAAE